MHSKKTIAWDIDDVLNNLTQIWFQKWLSGHPKTKISYRQITENPPHRLLGINKKDYLASLDEFRLSKQFQKMIPGYEIQKWFFRYGDNFRHIAITQAPLHTANRSAEWVLRNYGRWIRTFHFIPSLRKGKTIPGYDKSKKDFLLWFQKADILVDDNEKNIIDCKEIGIKGFIFPRPWNSHNKLNLKEALYELTEVINNRDVVND